MSTDTAKTKAGKRQALAKAGRRRTALKDLGPRKGQTKAVRGGGVTIDEVRDPASGMPTGK